MPVLRPIAVVAFVLGRQRTLIYRWVRDGELSAVCDVSTRELLIDLGEATRLDAAKPRRAARFLTSIAA